MIGIKLLSSAWTVRQRPRHRPANISTMRLITDYETVSRAVELDVKAKYEPCYIFALTITLICRNLKILRLMRKTIDKIDGKIAA